LALGAQKALFEIGDELQRKQWAALPFIGIGVESQVKGLVQNKVLTAAVVSAVTMGLALKILARAFETQQQPSERTVADSSSLPELSRLSPNH
jgi:multisubunit Na+/H+ antiporter MnhC subunit